jgi:hypothetical protein
MSLMMVLYYWDLFFLESITLMLSKPQRFKDGWFFPRSQVKPTTFGLVDRASLYQPPMSGMAVR